MILDKRKRLLSSNKIEVTGRCYTPSSYLAASDKTQRVSFGL